MAKKKKLCQDCGKAISRRAKRCVLCAGKAPKGPSFCQDCGKQVSRARHKRCPSCATTEQWKDKEWAERVKAARAWQYTDLDHVQQRKEVMDRNWADPDWAEQTIAAQNEGKRTPEARQRNAYTTAALWRDSEYRGKMETYLGSEERRSEFSAQRLAAWKRGCYDGVFRNPSSIEIQFAVALQEHGVPFAVQYRLEGDSRPFDFFIPPRLLVEVDGEYWHSLPGAAEKDAAKTELAKERGFILRRVPERAFKESSPLVIVQEHILPVVNEIDSLLELSSR